MKMNRRDFLKIVAATPAVALAAQLPAIEPKGSTASFTITTRHRINGHFVYCEDIKEHKHILHKYGKHKIVNYSYTLSFIVAIAQGPVTIEKIWFDGKRYKAPSKVFMHKGSTCVTFDNFQLGNYGNRIPSPAFDVRIF